MFPGILSPAVPIFSIPFFALSAGESSPDKNPEILSAADPIKLADGAPAAPKSFTASVLSSIEPVNSIPNFSASFDTGPPITVMIA